ncbi:FAD/NAD(P)-binding domain-containing protein [Dendrothele bispora CBS 962.96]|uniref:FAD/NAD(P)-binding domain-containing protein n=1 Tax=Dendrothele bispora (strain CBS 962.96) TaxID=1314807 RepID=A0A4S8MSI7_DENBC|nr:FAD/NAD(P)-binding domain-containing protein [Dendrothele bispora CBS 962.96]
MRLVLLASLISSSLALQLPFKVPFFQKAFSVEDDDSVHDTPRIAIIGAGAAGSSAAFWISKAQERFGVNVEIDVYERSSYVGGRSTTVYPHDDPSLPPVELGASIYVQSNKNMVKAAEAFNLSTKSFTDEEGSFGIWDGEQVIVQASGSWWDTLKLVWRYGVMSPRRVDSTVQDTVKQFLTLYSPQAPKWDNITDLAASFGWADAIQNTASDFFKSKGVSEQYIYEVLESSTRVNYAQNIDKIHALEGTVSMAADKATSIKDGNWRVFENFLNHSKATVYLNTSVHGVSQTTSSSRPWLVTSDKGSTRYRGVILAAPFHQTGIKLPSALSSQIPEQPYVHLHVTLLTTSSPHMSSEYLNMAPNTKPPSMLLTTWNGARQGLKAPEFNSISYHGKINEDEWVVKIFSMEAVEDEWLNSMFDGNVSWVYRKEWDAYPVLPPTTEFPPVKLDTGFYYVNAFEPFISTMETETIAARNVVDLLLNEQFRSSICGSRISASEQDIKKTSDDGFVFGWDC